MENINIKIPLDIAVALNATIKPAALIKKLSGTGYDIELQPLTGEMALPEAAAAKGLSYWEVWGDAGTDTYALELAIRNITGAFARALFSKSLIRGRNRNFLTIYPNEANVPVRMSRAITTDAFFDILRQPAFQGAPTLTRVQLQASNGNFVNRHLTAAVAGSAPLYADTRNFPVGANRPHFHEYVFGQGYVHSGFRSFIDENGQPMWLTCNSRGQAALSTRYPRPAQEQSFDILTVRRVALRSASDRSYLSAVGGGGRELRMRNVLLTTSEIFYMVQAPDFATSRKFALISANLQIVTTVRHDHRRQGPVTELTADSFFLQEAEWFSFGPANSAGALSIYAPNDCAVTIGANGIANAMGTPLQMGANPFTGHYFHVEYQS